jgi:hypothetical protein
VKQETDLQPILDVQVSQLESTLQAASTIDTKALAVLATNVALLIFMAQGHLAFAEWWQTLLLYGPIFISLVFDAIAIWPLDYVGPGLKPVQLIRHMNLSDQERMLQLISNTTNAIETNNTINQRRWRLCFRSIAFTVIGSLAILIYYI